MRSWNQPVLSNKGKVSCSRDMVMIYETVYRQIQTLSNIEHASRQL